ncbi:DUF2235 domain-containing protein [bacterium M00.F.Ca.ET.228.01.1.1]|nr:DUF2235 domain-containing protein [bacterium M00.F.Ca.ET.228.01.1.1]TGR96542.1 DUF2235 domain-containing protein [bacterium M00.F.Ca.ET.191.01.1.1]TGT97778.1 DUF2235 domain-containing protein [bacterium M00.F.Ca.ET.155.01.1.1]
MSKTIIFCADGTWNGPSNDKIDASPPSNVWKLFLQLAGDLDDGTLLLGSEQEKRLLGPDGQVAKYVHGVGASTGLIDKLFGGVFGSGTIERIVRGYTFVSRNYEEGDSIVLVGFSRGAYTARALGGLVSDMGLLNSKRYPLDDKALAYRLGSIAWTQHRQKRVKARVAKAGDSSLVQKFAEVLDDLPRFMSGQLTSEDFVPPQDGILAIAVWDTVGSLGIPVYLDNDDDRIDVFRFADTDLNPKVRFGLHAVSVDEQRGDFVPTLWTPRDNIKQVLFPGAHSDVGGGYSTDASGLSNGALVWMKQSLEDPRIGLKFRAEPALPLGDPLGVGHRPWMEGAFAFRPKGPRKVLEDAALANQLLFHKSLETRLAGTALSWLPPDSAVVYVPAVLETVIRANSVWE